MMAYGNDVKGAQETKKIAQEKGVNSSHLSMHSVDIRKSNEVQSLFELTKTTFPSNGVDILVNSAGVPLYKELIHVTDEEYDRLFGKILFNIDYLMNEKSYWWAS